MTDRQNQAIQTARQTIHTLQQRIKTFRTSEEFLTFLTAMSRFHRYSFNNQLLILAQRPDATRVAGFRTWKRFHRYVRKGEKGILIMVPIKNILHDEERDEDIPIVTGYSTAHVFDVSQTDGEPLPDIDLSVKEDDGSFLARCLMMAEMMGVTVLMRESMHADGVSRGGKVILRKDSNSTYMAATLLHELAHEKLHHNGEEHPLSREQRELEAETVAYMVADHFSVEIPAHKYLATWQQSGNIMDSLKRISECSSEMIEALSAITQTVRVPLPIQQTR